MKKVLAKIAFVGGMLLVAAGARLRKRQAKIKIKQHYGLWMVRLEFTLEDLEEAMKIYYAQKDLINLREDAYRLKLLEYIQETIFLNINEHQVKLLASDFKVDKNQVDIMWTMDDMPNGISEINISVKTCAELLDQSTKIQFYYQKMIHRYLLDSSNDFEVNFKV